MLILHLPSWFPQPEKPLAGNFILRQIASVAPLTTSIVLHHVDIDFKDKCASLMDQNIIFRPIFTQRGTSSIQMVRAYDYEVEKIIKKYGKPDLLHLHVALPLGPLAVFLSKRYHIPLLISEHWSAYQPQNRGGFSLKQRFFLQQVYRRASHLTTVSEDLHQAIISTVSSAKKVPYTQVSNVVDVTKFYCVSSCVKTPASEKKKMIHISTLEDESKNIMGILRTIKRLSMVRRDFELDIIHDLKNEAVERFIREEMLEDCVHLLGKKSEAEVASAIQSCDFMLQFSNYENQPCVLLESFCCGKPVIATSVGGIIEIATDQNARLIAPRDEEALLQQLVYMLDHFSDYDAQKISLEATSQYATEAIGEQFMEVYRSL